MTDVETRLAALREQGWRLVQERAGGLEPIPGESGMFRERPGSYVLERSKSFNGARIREVGETLEQAVTRASWQEDRISQLDNTTVQVSTGLLAHERK